MAAPREVDPRITRSARRFVKLSLRAVTAGRAKVIETPREGSMEASIGDAGAPACSARACATIDAASQLVDDATARCSKSA